MLDVKLWRVPHRLVIAKDLADALRSASAASGLQPIAARPHASSLKIAH